MSEVKKEKEIEVELLHDVWVEDETAVGGTRRITTNTPILDADGRQMVDKRTKQLMVTIEKRMLPIKVAQQQIKEGKARLTEASMEKIASL